MFLFSPAQAALDQPVTSSPTEEQAKRESTNQVLLDMPPMQKVQRANKRSVELTEDARGKINVPG